MIASEGVMWWESSTRISKPLLGSELTIAAGFSADRRRAFTTGRALAREALVRAGFEAAELGQDSAGAPIWPQGARGSISHSGDRTVAVVCESRRYSGIGVDVEALLSLARDEHLPSVSVGDRKVVRAGLGASVAVSVDLLAFSAKESSFKAHHGAGLAVRTLADLCVVDVTPTSQTPGIGGGRASGEFRVVTIDSSTSVGGRWFLSGHHVETLALVRNDPA